MNPFKRLLLYRPIVQVITIALIGWYHDVTKFYLAASHFKLKSMVFMSKQFSRANTT